MKTPQLFPFNNRGEQQFKAENTRNRMFVKKNQLVVELALGGKFFSCFL